MKSVGTTFQKKGTACMKALRGRKVWHVQGTKKLGKLSLEYNESSGSWHKIGSERRDRTVTQIS